MRSLALMVLSLLVSLSLACDNRSNSPVVMETGEYVFLDGQIVNAVEVVQITEGMAGNLKESQIRLKSRMSTSLTIHIRARFYDPAGREVRSSFSQWDPLIIAGRSEKSFTAVSPDTTVTRIKFEIRSSSTEASIKPDEGRE